MTASIPIRRALFVLTILTGSFLLFLVQPMVARMALPRLGGAPNVWNSAMLVYQALLLAGYYYAHRLSQMPMRRQATWHLVLLLVAAVTLPIALADLPAPSPGSEVWWVPLLFFASVGPVFFLVSAQAPLMQRWYAAHPGAGEPWALYAASNLGSFAGLIAYPLLAEPFLRLQDQSWVWSIGYGLLIVLIALAARARWHSPLPFREGAGGGASQQTERMDDRPHPNPSPEGEGLKVPARRIVHWLILAAIPSGLMLSTTTHLTTDIFAMPLLWVIPLGLYLLSFVAAFSDQRYTAYLITLTAPLIMLVAGGGAMASRYSVTLVPVAESVALLFVVSVVLHARMYDLRPAADQLTLFYLTMSAGGALGGLFTALIAPTVFDWVWEHPLLVLAAAALMPLPKVLDWARRPELDPRLKWILAGLLLLVAAYLAFELYALDPADEGNPLRVALILAMAAIGLAMTPWRWAFLLVLLMLMLARGGVDTVRTTIDQARARSYFGIYTVRDYPDQRLRSLAHGTTLHGWQSLDPARSREPMTYYGPGSGVALALGHARVLYGEKARIGVVGLGTGTLACFRKPGELWHFFEIDPEVLQLSRDGTFTFVRQCAPAAKATIGDARIELARLPKASFDMLAIDAFSSDAIPLHLLTDEAMGVYLDTLSPRGVLLVHISNRYIELEPVLSALAKQRGLALIKRDDNPYDRTYLTPSTWVALSRDPAVLDSLAKSRNDAAWGKLMPPASKVWTDDHASILPHVRWQYLMRKP